MLGIIFLLQISGYLLTFSSYAEEDLTESTVIFLIGLVKLPKYFFLPWPLVTLHPDFKP